MRGPRRQALGALICSSGSEDKRNLLGGFWEWALVLLCREPGRVGGEPGQGYAEVLLQVGPEAYPEPCLGKPFIIIPFYRKGN